MKFVTLLAIALTLVACARDSTPEQQVRATLAAAEHAAEARDVGEAMALVAEGYRDARGFDKTQLAGFVRGYFVLHPSIELLMRVESLEFPADDLARARVAVGMLGRRGPGQVEAGAGEAPGDEAASDGAASDGAASDEAWRLAADVETFDLELVREGGDWRLLRADRSRERGR